MIDDADSASPLLRIATLLFTIAVTVLFLVMIRSFLIALIMAALFTGLAYPLHRRILTLCRGRRTLAPVVTLLVLLLAVILPVLGLLGIVAAQALEISQSVIPWVQERIQHPDALQLRLPDWVPFRDKILHPSPQFVSKMAELASSAGGFLANSLAAAAVGTAAFFINLFVMLYAMFWFLRDGQAVSRTLMGYAPLPHTAKALLVERGMSMTRATIKGTFVIGLVQGTLGGIAFAVVGIDGAAFWGAIMGVASFIPSVGTALVWVPATIYLFVVGDTVSAAGLLAWCAGVVGSVDNLLRARLVGGDTQLPDVLILVSTLGGLSLFGAVGVLLGPMIAALFTAMWDVHAEVFRDQLGGTEPESS